MWGSRIRRRLAVAMAAVRHWPQGRRARGRGSAKARREAEALERALDLWRVEAAGADLAERIVRRAAELPQRPAPSARPGEALFVWPFASPWPGIAGIVLALLLGILLGWQDARENGEPPPLEDWPELAALSPIQEDFTDR